MSESPYHEELMKCVRCGACKTPCPTYLTTRNETMGARGRIALLGELGSQRLNPSKRMAEMIYSCMLCGACKNLCPAGIDIPEAIYRGRAELKKSHRRGRLLRKALKYSASHTDAVFGIMRWLQKPLFRKGRFRHVPEITPHPFKKNIQVYKTTKKISRTAVFAGCSVNYFYPDLGYALSNILLKKGHEVVVFSGESCCGAPLRSSGMEKEASRLAEKNIEHFNKVRAESIISLCPTCTMVIREQYPLLAGSTIPNIVDLNEFIAENGITDGLETEPKTVTYHDPCHLGYGLGIRDEPRQILQGISGITLKEMKHASECCGFAGLFSVYFRELSMDIGKEKMKNILDTGADTVVTSCPGCVMQLEALKSATHSNIIIKHIVELINEAMSRTS